MSFEFLIPKLELIASKGYQNEEAVAIAIRESGLDRSELYITSKYSGINSLEEAIRASLEKVRYHLLFLLQIIKLIFVLCS